MQYHIHSHHKIPIRLWRKASQQVAQKLCVWKIDPKYLSQDGLDTLIFAKLQENNVANAAYKAGLFIYQD